MLGLFPDQTRWYLRQKENEVKEKKKELLIGRKEYSWQNSILRTGAAFMSRKSHLTSARLRPAWVA